MLAADLASPKDVPERVAREGAQAGVTFGVARDDVGEDEIARSEVVALDEGVDVETVVALACDPDGRVVGQETSAQR